MKPTKKQLKEELLSAYADAAELSNRAFPKAGLKIFTMKWKTRLTKLGIMTALMLMNLVLAVTSSEAQINVLIPPEAPAIIRTNFAVVTAVDSANHESAPSNEVQITNQPVTLIWEASPSTNVATYMVRYSRTSSNYTSCYNVGNNLTAGFPPPPASVRVRVTSGPSEVICQTNPTGSIFFRQRLVGSNWVSVLSSGDSVTWTNPFLMLATSNAGLLVITQEQIPVP